MCLKVMKIDYIFVNPGGNPTVLVTSKILRKNQTDVANKIMELTASEQVGFIEPAKNPKACCRLQMAGGEFCGNALRSAAVYLAQSLYAQGIEKTNYEFILESSGTDQLLSVTSFFNKKVNFWEAEVEMPRLNKVNISNNKTFVCNTGMLGRQVDLPGITQILVDKSYFDSAVDFNELFRSLYKKKQIIAPACGIIFYQKLTKKRFSITPVVYIRKTKTFVFETSCASGSVALVLNFGLNKSLVKQPSGCNLRVDINSVTKKVRIGGVILETKIGTMRL